MPDQAPGMKHRRGIDLTAPINPARYVEHQPAPGVFLTVATLSEWEVLGAKCGQCGRVSWLDKRQVVRRFGNQYLHNLDGKLVCRCGNRAGNKVLVGTLGRD